MKKTIAILAAIIVANGLHAADLGSVVDRIVADLHITATGSDLKDARHHRVRPARHHIVHKKNEAKKRYHKHRRKKAQKPRKAHKLIFHSLNEYKKIKRSRAKYHRALHNGASKHTRRHLKSSKSKKLSRYVGNGWYSDDDGYYNEEWEDIDYRWDRPKRHRQHGYKYYRRQWYLTYLYERASFYDSYGFFYGYFDRYGFMFDGRFYRYDHNYTYQDRLHGKGLFEHRYYRPQRYRKISKRWCRNIVF